MSGAVTCVLLDTQLTLEQQTPGRHAALMTAIDQRSMSLSQPETQIAIVLRLAKRAANCGFKARVRERANSFSVFMNTGNSLFIFSSVRVRLKRFQLPGETRQTLGGIDLRLSWSGWPMLSALARLPGSDSYSKSAAVCVCILVCVVPVDWKTPGLHWQYLEANASIIRSIFWASPGSLKLHRNCLQQQERERK